MRDLFIAAVRSTFHPRQKIDYSKDDNFHGATVRFLGLWDTVAAYGMPVDEMTRGISDYIFPLLLPSFELDPRVKRACHALSIDEERTTFRPVLWDERAEPPPVPRDGKRYLVDERISQVWFAGVHSNVGGGYPDDLLAHIPLVWIMNEAANAGLTFKTIAHASPQTLLHPPTVEDKDGRQYDPRSGLGGYYRYGPRDIDAIGKELLSRRGDKAIPKIHESVLARIKNNAQLYAPNGIPAEYDVVTTAGEVLSPAQNPYESPAQATARKNIQEKTWNVIWQRRIIYFLTVAASLYLALFPLEKQLPRQAEYESKVRWVSDVVRMLGSFLPDATDTWINGYARDPSRLLWVTAILIALIWWGSRLAARIRNEMGVLWGNSLAARLPSAMAPTDFIYRLRTAYLYQWLLNAVKRTVAPLIFAVLTIYLAFAVSSHLAFNIQDDAGLVCHEVDGARKLETGQTVVTDSASLFVTKDVCQNTKIAFELGGHYYVKVAFKEPFLDGNIEASKGIYLSDPPSYWQRIIMAAALPLRRELIRPWFRIVARTGGVGGEETFLDPDPADGSIEEVIVAKRDGQLFLFVNDAVIGFPGLYGVFYGNNHGAAEITITRRR